MRDKLQIRLPDGSITSVAYGTEAGEVLEASGFPGESGPVAATVNNVLVSLKHRLKINSTLCPVTIDDERGARVYRKTLTALLSRVCTELYPDRRLMIGHSLSTGYFCYFDNIIEVPDSELQKIDGRLRELTALNEDICIEYLSYEEACGYFSNNDSKRLLLLYRNDSMIPVYRIGDWMDLAYEPLLKSTGLLKHFELLTYKPGFILRYPHSGIPGKLDSFEDNPLLRSVYNEYKAWGKILNVSCAGELNRLTGEKEIKEFIWAAESLHEKKLSQIADRIAEKRDDLKVILIAGPSSSGKTTFTKKLAIHLRVLGFNPLQISLDDYYVPRLETPLDENGKYDFEALEAIDVPLLNTHLLRLFDGKEVRLPSYNFKTGLREEGKVLQMHKRNILLLEGIHGLNNKLTHQIPPNQKYKIYISALTQLNLDDNNRIATTDNRLLRRIVRDYQFRGYDALKTLGMWDSVRRGEKKNIFPFQNNADSAFNSALDYELAVLKNLAIPVLKEVKPWNEEYGEAVRLMSFLENFITIPVKDVPMNSILREFIGDSGFKY